MRSFIRIRPVILGDMPWTHTVTHTHTATEGHSNSLAKCSTKYKIMRQIQKYTYNYFKMTIYG